MAKKVESKKKVRAPTLRMLIRKYIRLYYKKFRLPNWPMFFRGVPDLITGETGLKVLAHIVVNTEDNQVMVSYDTKLRPDETVISRLMAHEMLHWVFDAVDTFVEDKMSAEDVNHYRNIQEIAIETVAIALANARQETSCPEWWFKEGSAVSCEH